MQHCCIKIPVSLPPFLMLRRRLLSSLLALVLLLALQGGVLHALSHVEPALADASQAPASDGHHAGERLCTLCLAFAPLGAALPSAPAVAPVSTAVFCPPAASPAPSARVADAAPYHSRAPPSSSA